MWNDDSRYHEEIAESDENEDLLGNDAQLSIIATVQVAIFERHVRLFHQALLTSERSHLSGLLNCTSLC